MIRIEKTGVTMYRLVEDKQVSRIETRTETRTIALGLNQSDAIRIARIMNQAELREYFDIGGEA